MKLGDVGFKENGVPRPRHSEAGVRRSRTTPGAAETAEVGGYEALILEGVACGGTEVAAASWLYGPSDENGS